MEKLLDYISITDSAKCLYPIRPAGGSLIKQAAASEWPPEVIDFISKMVPKEHMHYSLCNALGAGEYWSSNVNGDFFEKDELVNSHHTFLNGTPFMHHINKDPAKGYGEIVFSAYNPRMNRVELVVGHDVTKLPADAVRKLENDEPVHLSMGCRVSHDVCSICGNPAPSPKNYCEHVTKYGLNYVFPDGRKVYVLNPNPDFFDISIVIVPADKTACVLAKIFGATKTAQAMLDPYRGFRELVGVPSAVRAANVKAAEELAMAHTSPLPALEILSFSEINKIAETTKTAGGLLASLSNSNKYLLPNEVQAVLLTQMGRAKIAQGLLTHKAYFESSINVLPDHVIGNIPEKMPSLPKLANKSERLIKSAALSEQDLSLTSIPFEEMTNSVMGLTPDLLEDIARASMITAIIGKAMSGSMGSLPIVGLGSSVAAQVLRNRAPSESDLLRRIALRRDLYVEPLIRSKKASENLTLAEIYSIPFMCRP
jgi:hypothetical protein